MAKRPLEDLLNDIFESIDKLKESYPDTDMMFISNTLENPNDIECKLSIDVDVLGEDVFQGMMEFVHNYYYSTADILDKYSEDASFVDFWIEGGTPFSDN